MRLIIILLNVMYNINKLDCTEKKKKSVPRISVKIIIIGANF